jgi:hypothetical protein
MGKTTVQGQATSSTLYAVRTTKYFKGLAFRVNLFFFVRVHIGVHRSGDPTLKIDFFLAKSWVWLPEMFHYLDSSSRDKQFQHTRLAPEKYFLLPSIRSINLYGREFIVRWKGRRTHFFLGQRTLSTVCPLPPKP